jgi:LysM repeat protein
MDMKRLIIALALIAVLLMTACTRSAESSNPTAESAEGELPFPTSEFPQMDILQTAAVATQTALAGGGQTGGEQATPGAPAATPGEGQPTQPPQPESTSQPAAPTSTPQPTTPPEPIDCDSPYTVQKGDWVYKIGRNCGVDPNEIIRLNGLVWPFLLHAGDQLILPQ